jgi:RND family efflux transporter MFP subunit
MNPKPAPSAHEPALTRPRQGEATLSHRMGEGRGEGRIWRFKVPMLSHKRKEAFDEPERRSPTRRHADRGDSQGAGSVTGDPTAKFKSARPVGNPLSFLLGLLFIAAIGGVLPVGCSKGVEVARQPTLYTCGMHPQVVQDHPGNCPICGMKLTPVRKSDAGQAGTNPSAIAVDPVTRQNMGIRTSEVVLGPLRRIIRTVANVDYDETTLLDVTTKFKGWIEKLHVNATGQLVNPGDPLFDIYSPELYSAQVEYALASKSSATNDPGAAGLREAARSKLKFFDISDAQIAELERTHQPRKTLVIHASAAGFVTEKMAVEGQMVDAGMKLYRLADIGIVWVHAQVYEQDLPWIQLGQEATMSLSYLPDRHFRGRVTYIYPSVDEKTRTAKVRMEFHNPGYFLKPGMFATVELMADIAPSALLVPDSAVLRSGQKNTVFVALPGGRFEPRTVTLGMTAENDRLQVLSGLRAGERVVTSGQFMLDSESQLREAIEKMREPGGSPSAAGPDDSGAAGRAAPVAGATPRSQETLWVCPMPEHVSIEYHHPGKCPICAMALVPVSRSTLEQIQPGGKVLYYTCPMPEHSDVRADKPGKCPHCSMTLIPVMEQPQKPAADAAAMTGPLYTCPMASHADVVSDRTGKCPKCDMDLVPTSTVNHGSIAEANWRKEQAGPQQH